MDKRQEPAQRKCLSCGKTFHSAWAGNRICPKCSSSPRFNEGTGMRVVTSDMLRKYP